MTAFPTLSKPPSFPLDPDGTLEDIVIRSQLASGYEQTRPRATRSRRNFGLNYIGIPDADIALLRTFEMTTLVNGAGSFTWTHPLTSIVYTVRLSAPIKYARTQAVLGASNATIQMREV